MYIEFEKYPFTITDIIYNDNINYVNKITLITNGNKNFVFNAVGDCCSCSYFRIWENYDFNSLKGKIISSCKCIDIPDDFSSDSMEPDEYSYNDCSSYHLYEINFTNSDEIFKFMLVNYSNGYYDGWIESSVIDK